MNNHFLSLNRNKLISVTQLAMFQCWFYGQSENTGKLRWVLGHRIIDQYRPNFWYGANRIHVTFAAALRWPLTA